MGLDILGALRRMVTLPKAANSLSDILGGGAGQEASDALKAVITTIHEVVADAITSAVHVLTTTSTTELASAQQFIADQITHSLSGVSPDLAAAILAAVGAEFKSLDQLAEANIVKLSTDLLAEVGKVLGTAAK